MNERYEKIINLRKEASKKHPQMSLSDRAAQFAPFAALVGFESAVSEEARVTDKRIELDEYEIERLDSKLRLAVSEEEMKISVTYFRNDKKKSGGAYLVEHGKVLRIDEYERRLILNTGAVIPIDDIINIEEMTNE